MPPSRSPRTVDDLLLWLGGDAMVVGERDRTFDRVEPLFEATPGSLTWARADLRGGEEYIRSTGASVVICDRNVAVPDEALAERTFVRVARPDIAFLRALKGMYPPPRSVPGVHPTAIVDPRAEIAPDAAIAAFTVIGRCRIGAGSSVGPFTMIHDGVEMGANVHVREHCTVGGEGFGHILNERGDLENFPHVGIVVLEDDVELFPYVNVDRATLHETRVERGARIDHYAHIGHNSRVGPNAMIAAHTVLAGGAQVGAHAFVGLGVRIRDRLRVGAHTVVGMGSVVTKPIPDGETWAGVPAAPIPRR